MRLTRKIWEESAYAALLAGGPRAVNVAPLAKALGTTRGSFYHHFSSRSELLEAALTIWEYKATEKPIRYALEEDPKRRLKRLFTLVFKDAGFLSQVEVQLAAEQDDPIVAQVLKRVSDRRLEFLADCYRELGYTSKEAKERAMLTYLVFVGSLHATLGDSSNPAIRMTRVGALLSDLLIEQ